ncbi:hypothetical protein BN1723_010768 [Verticillium longisporum]|uniref:aldehyde dehydrogenase (NAD(+)) n=1 Tax=Verticillium longisporum TaxID=100787 RepID=A0A0G4L0Z4_VERLO|nr:hypothetical protein BN1723_010768 [Verticillium longisporum]
MTQTENTPARRPAFSELPLRKGDPSYSAWGLWGLDDQLGTLNLITPSVVKNASSEIKDGLRFSLNWSLSEPKTPGFRRHEFAYEHSIVGPGNVLDDTLNFNTQKSTQWDGLRHFAYQKEGLFYNGITKDDMLKSQEGSLGIHNWHTKGGIATRGFLIDYWAYAELVGQKYDPSTPHAIKYDDIVSCLEWQHGQSPGGLEPQPGDILIIRSGFTARYVNLSAEEEKNGGEAWPPASCVLKMVSLPPRKFFIGNEFVDSQHSNGQRITLLNPVDDSVVVDDLQLAGKEDVDRAVALANEAFRKGPWASFTGVQRAACLNKFADIVEKNVDHLAYCESLPTGRPIAGIIHMDLAHMAQVFRYYAGWADKIAGQSFSEDNGFAKIVRYEPLGVCASLASYNATFLYIGWKLAPALAAGNTICVAASRVLIQESIATKFIQAIKEVFERARDGMGSSPLELSTQHGPVVDKSQFDRIMGYIEKGKQSAELVTGGNRKGSKGCFIEPTLFVNPTSDSPIWKEEIFGPVLTVKTFKTEKEAIELANDTVYGLASCLYTSDLSRALRVSSALESGGVSVNSPYLPELNTPFGGSKQSGQGRELGSHGLYSYLEPKSVHIKITAAKL